MANKNKIVAIYLAAGRSSRMGRNKLLLPLRGNPLGMHALQAALQSNLDRIIVVVNDDEPSMQKGILNSSAKWPLDFSNKLIVVSCPDSKKELSYSLKVGINWASTLDPDGVIILLADQPFIRKEMINQLIDTFLKEKVNYVASCFNDIIRPPILLGRRLFPLLHQLKGDEGAKKLLIESPQIEGRTIHYDDEILFLDVDTMGDYERILEMIAFRAEEKIFSQCCER